MHLPDFPLKLERTTGPNMNAQVSTRKALPCRFEGVVRCASGAKLVPPHICQMQLHQTHTLTRRTANNATF